MQNYRVDQKRQISHTSWSWTIEISHWTEIYNVAAYLVLTKIWLGKSQQLLHQIFIELNFGHLLKYYTYWQCSLGGHLATNKKIPFNIVRLDKWDAGRIFFSTPTHLAILRTSVYYKTFSYRRGTKNLSRVCDLMFGDGVKLPVASKNLACCLLSSFPILDTWRTYN